MDPVNYTYIPVAIALFLQLISPYWSNMYCIESPIVPHWLLCVGVFLGSYVIFGILLWKASESPSDTKLFAYLWVLVALNLIWVKFYRHNKNISLVLLFLSLVFGYFVYNGIFLSNMTRDTNTTLYLDIFVVYLVWIGFMITILIESMEREIEMDIKKNIIQ